MQYLQILLMITIVLMTKAMADDSWYTFWPADQDNSKTIDAPDGQPTKNFDFYKMLHADALKDTVYASTSSYIGKDGVTSFWTAQISDDVVQQKYSDLKILAAVQSTTIIQTVENFGMIQTTKKRTERSFSVSAMFRRHKRGQRKETSQRLTLTALMPSVR